MGFWKKAASLTLGAALLLGIAACGKNNETSSQPATPEQPGTTRPVGQGRYLETDITPADLVGSPTDFIVGEDGAYHLLTTHYDIGEGSYTYTRYRSGDEGASWQRYDLSWLADYVTTSEESFASGVMKYFAGGMVLLPDSRLLAGLETLDTASFTTSFEFVCVDLEGARSDFALEGLAARAGDSFYLSNMQVLPGGRLLVRTTTNLAGGDDSQAVEVPSQSGVYSLSDGSFLYELEGWTGLGWVANSGTLVAEREAGGYMTLSLADGAEQSLNLATDAIALAGASGGSATAMLDEDYNLFLFDSSGLAQVEAGSATTLMSGVNYSFGSPLVSLASAILLADDSIVAVVQSEDTVRLYRYIYDAAMPTQAEEHISVHAVYDSDSLRYALYSFKQQNPGITLGYSYDFSRVDIVGAEELAAAVNRLSASLQSGDGPDLVLLDGVNHALLAEEGLLADIADLVAADTELNTTLIQPLFTGEALYVLPTRYALPVLVGSETGLAGIQNVADVAADLAFSDLQDLAQVLYGVSAPALAGGEGLDALQPAFAAAGDLPEGSGFFNHQPQQQMSASLSAYVAGGAQAGYTPLYTLDTLLSVTETMHNQLVWEGRDGNDIVFAPQLALAPALSEGDVYQSCVVVGVSATGETALAKRLLGTMLSAEVQTQDFAEGLPVNTTALAAQVAAYENNGAWLTDMGYTLCPVSAEALRPQNPALALYDAGVLASVYDAALMAG